MWLLSTSHAELHFFPDPTTIKGGYAILSHAWGKDEQTFLEIRRIGEKCRPSGTNPLDFVSDKVRGCCIRAATDGYNWAWIDTCCIDKTSSTELSEAINSMFSWYACAEVCYAYLEDVPSGCDVTAPDSPFRAAKWHTRGWTLQELLAPALVVFVSQDWNFTLGTKQELAPVLSRITGIAEPYLSRERLHHHASIAERMSWASHRVTTRPEDEAYCLLGLFDLNMPTIYGEGRRAFQRFQEELAKQTHDTSLFAWGEVLDTAHKSLKPISHQDIVTQFHSPTFHDNFLFAPAPSAFTPHSGTKVIYFTPRHPTPIQPYLASQRRRTVSASSEINCKYAQMFTGCADSQRT